MYVIIRIFLTISIICLLVIAYRKWLRKIFNKPWKKAVSITLAVLILPVLIYYPIEGLWLRFDNIYDSLNYKHPIMSGNNNYVVTGDDCAFIGGIDGNEILFDSVNKYENGWGVPGFMSTFRIYSGMEYNETPCVYNAYVVKNEYSNNLCTFVSFKGDNSNTKITAKNSGKEFVELKQTENNSYKNTDNNERRLYYCVEQGDFPSEFSIYVNDIEVEFNNPLNISFPT